MKGPRRKALPDQLINQTRLSDVQHWKITDGARAREEELKERWGRGGSSQGRSAIVFMCKEGCFLSFCRVMLDLQGLLDLQ